METTKNVLSEWLKFFNGQFDFMKNKLAGVETWQNALIEQLKSCEQSASQSQSQRRITNDTYLRLEDTLQRLTGSLTKLKQEMNDQKRAIRAVSERLKTLERRSSEDKVP